MFQILINIAFLGLITMPIFILILAFYQNLLESIRPKTNKKPSRSSSSYTGSDELGQPKLRIVK